MAPEARAGELADYGAGAGIRSPFKFVRNNQYTVLTRVSVRIPTIITINSEVANVVPYQAVFRGFKLYLPSTAV